MKSSPKAKRTAAPQLGFLLSQVGAHSTSMFAKSLVELDLKPAHVGILRAISEYDGESQQTLCRILGMFASRLTVLCDELERRGLVERKDSATDKRTYCLSLTKAGQVTLDEINAISVNTQAEVFGALSSQEKQLLSALLMRIAEDQKLTYGVHPDLQK